MKKYFVIAAKGTITLSGKELRYFFTKDQIETET